MQEINSANVVSHAGQWSDNFNTLPSNFEQIELVSENVDNTSIQIPFRKGLAMCSFFKFCYEVPQCGPELGLLGHAWTRDMIGDQLIHGDIALSQ